jgi:hypothetical protein
MSSTEGKVKIKKEIVEQVDLKDTDIETLEIAEEISIKQRAMEAAPRDPTVKSKAFELYMDHVPYRKIEETLNVPKGTLLSWVYNGEWAKKREENDELTLKDALESKKALLNNIALEVMEGVLKAIKRDTKDGGFKTKDVPTYLAALSSIEKLSRLSLGLATSISEERSKRAQFVIPTEHLKQIQDVKIKDPFAAEDAVEVKPNEPTGSTGRPENS